MRDSGNVYRDQKVPLTEDQRLLRKRVLHQIETEPETFDMSSWEGEYACGTTRCLAGWAVFFGGESERYKRQTSWSDDAIRLLGLTSDECMGGRVILFYETKDAALGRMRELAGD